MEFTTRNEDSFSLPTPLRAGFDSWFTAEVVNLFARTRLYDSYSPSDRNAGSNIYCPKPAKYPKMP